MEVIRLKQKEEVAQLDRLLDGLAKKRQNRQHRGLLIAYGALALGTIAGFGALNHKIEVVLAEPAPTVHPATRATPATCLKELPDIEVVLQI